MGRESMMTRANQQAKQLIHFNTVYDSAERLKKIEAISADSVMKAAQKIFSGSPTLAALGPLAQLESFDDVRKRL
jgi:predicted Zn-dependent peptidase